jgi:nifR3 family TIM-barrel protein
MKKNFWKKLADKKKPFFALAPMADVTDIAERQMLTKYGKPDVLYTEFVSCDGFLNKEGRKVLIKDLCFKKNEHPIVAQFFGSKPENFLECAKLAKEMGFDGFEINMGCPDKSVMKQGAGAMLMKKPKLVREIIRAAKKGAESAGWRMPVSVKTRIGFNKNEIETWLPELLAEKPAVIIIHGRTKKEMSAVPAHWDVIARAVEIAKGSGVLIMGNGDATSLEDGIKKAKESGVDGIMVGRGIFGNPWFFNPNIKDISVENKLYAMIEHTKLFEKELSSKGIKGFHVMKKHFKAYASGFDGAKEIRAKLMETNSAKEAEKIVRDFLDKVV